MRNSNLKTILNFLFIDVIPNLNLNNILTMLSTRVYSCLGCGKRMKSTYKLTNNINTCTSQQVFSIHMQPEQDMLILGEDNNVSENFGPHKDDKSEEQDIEGDHRNLVGKRSDIESHVKDGLLGRTPQDGLLANKLSASLKEVRFSKQEFLTSKPVSDIKYPHFASQNNNPFYPLNDQLDYALATYFAESETMKDNIDRFLSNPLMALLTEKLSYQNVHK